MISKMENIVRLAIVGGRDFADNDYMKKCLQGYRKENTVIQVVSGGARGADSLGEGWAKENGIPTKIFPAQWDKYGKSAGFRRNKDIVANCDAIAAFWDGRSKGTENTISIARMNSKKVTIFKY